MNAAAKRRISMLGCPVDLLSPQELLADIEQALHSNARIRLEGLNVAKLVDARRTPDLMLALEQAERVHIDGAGIHLGLRWLNPWVPPRRAGIDLVGDLCALAARLDAPVFLLGAKARVVHATADRLTAQYPGLRIAGVHHGYFKAEEEADIAQAIRASGAKLLFIGISSPKKENFLRQHWDQLGVNLGMGVGGSFDVLSGQLPRAPRWVQRICMEWCFRMLLEPRRLAWRYLSTNYLYSGLLLAAKLNAVTAKRQKPTT
ncbi:UDP-N-acetyl-D-mannosamine transferase [Pseudomonas alcaligenes]|uniref:UDP-N-acetyl-D-mannosamine transferase n=1 Tax=Aquipseudomonas alcaligenes TaxID=43263 RepID=A0ABR7S089_AQUAC|nr:WecB/TagA/CpsF family glycosyltransferase [Pseudomonas alcaligenes]MBC9250127.1 UDP-N-acetyl-D-mannosamine transferase [Pseudomonas alcaligenes]